VRLVQLAVTGFRNLEPLALSVPAEGMAFLGPNGHGKTNVLEAAYYPVLFRSLRGAADAEMVGFGGPGFKLDCNYADDGVTHDVAVRYTASPKRKRITVDGADIERLADAVGLWLAVAFIPTDTNLASGPAAGRRLYLDRLLSLADREYLGALTRYRAALAQRNAALKQRSSALGAFEPALIENGAAIVRRRLDWLQESAGLFSEEFRAMGETAQVDVNYVGRDILADPGAWPEILSEVRSRDEARGTTTVGPHRDDLALELDGRPLRTYGSTGQQRSAAVALKLLEWDTLARWRNTEPTLLLDDVFAELDTRRQGCLAERLRRLPRAQVLVSAPRPDELPEGLDLPLWHLHTGAVSADG
jgi:DNA replication and repair protein RecF